MGVNAYATPPANRGFATHYDTHDVFVLQVAGRKQWRVHEPVVPDPLEQQASGGRPDEVGARSDTLAVLEVVLAPGDALYLPRGWLHSATALGEQSLHLTVGVRAMNRYSLVGALFDLAREEAALRSGFPVGLDVTDPEQLAPHLQATLAALQEWLGQVDADRVAAQLRTRAWQATRPAPIRPLAQTAAMGEARWRHRAGASSRAALADHREPRGRGDRAPGRPHDHGAGLLRARVACTARGSLDPNRRSASARRRRSAHSCPADAA